MEQVKHQKKMNILRGYSNLIPVAPSRWLTNCIRESALFCDRKAYTVPNVIDTDFYSPKPKIEIREKYNLPHDKKLIMACAMGYNNPFKGIQYLIKSMEILANELYEYIVVGECSIEQFPSAIRNKVHLLGYISNQSEMMKLYNCADLLIITSMAENFPNVVIEAMACGVPVVGFATGGIKDQIQHKKNGWIVEQKDVQGLVDGVHWILEEANYSELQENARNYVLKNCSYENVLKIHGEILGSYITKE